MLPASFIVTTIRPWLFKLDVMGYNSSEVAVTLNELTEVRPYIGPWTGTVAAPLAPV